MKHWKPEDLEKVMCDLCKTDINKGIIVRPDSLKVVECVGCGLSYLNPRPKADLISKLYESAYFTKPDQSASGGSIGYPDYFSERNRPFLSRLAAEKYAVVRRYVNLRGLRCLEVGCAAGDFSAVLRQKGSQVVGIDLSLRAIQEAKSRYPEVDFRQADITALNNESFDAVFAFEVIEHVTSPTDFLRAASVLLKPGGWLILSTPNYACGKSVGVERWFGFSTSFEHLYFFTPDALSRCASAAGLVTVDWLTDHDDGILCPNQKPPAAMTTRLLFKGLLARLGILNFARVLRNKVALSGSSYRKHGKGHNLLMVMKQSDRL